MPSSRSRRPPHTSQVTDLPRRRGGKAQAAIGRVYRRSMPSPLAAAKAPRKTLKENRTHHREEWKLSPRKVRTPRYTDRDLGAGARRYVARQGGVLWIGGEAPVASKPRSSRKHVADLNSPQIRKKRQYAQGKRKYARLVRAAHSTDYGEAKLFDFITLGYGKQAPRVRTAQRHFRKLITALRNRKLLGEYFGVIEFGPRVHFHLLLWAGQHTSVERAVLATRIRKLWKLLIGRFGKEPRRRLVHIGRDDTPVRFMSYMLKRQQKRFDLPGKMYWASRGIKAEIGPEERLSILEERRLRYLIAADMAANPQTAQSAWVLARLSKVPAFLARDVADDYLAVAKSRGGTKDWRIAGRDTSELESELFRIANIGKGATRRRR